eukprot:gene14610-biopygen631
MDVVWMQYGRGMDVGLRAPFYGEAEARRGRVAAAAQRGAQAKPKGCQSGHETETLPERHRGDSEAMPEAIPKRHQSDAEAKPKRSRRDAEATPQAAAVIRRRRRAAPRRRLP